MATTSLWAVRGTIRDVVAYVKDPNKTANPDYDLKNVLTYASDNEKTEKQYYVTGLNCSPHFAFERMTATKERYGKRGGIVGYHGYQSFKPGELTPGECHKIGVLTAQRMWGDRFIVEIFERDEATPSYAQTVRFRRLHSEGKLTADTIEDIMAKPKANQRETVKFSYERIACFFPPNYSTKQMEDAIVQILEERRREVGATSVPRRRDDAERG